MRVVRRACPRKANEPSNTANLNLYHTTDKTSFKRQQKKDAHERNENPQTGCLNARRSCACSNASSACHPSKHVQRTNKNTKTKYQKQKTLPEPGRAKVQVPPMFHQCSTSAHQRGTVRPPRSARRRKSSANRIKWLINAYKTAPLVEPSVLNFI